MIEDFHHPLEPFHVPNWVFLSLAWVIVAGTIAFTWFAYPLLPNPIPTHFNLAGTPDDFSPKGFWVVFFPVLIQIVLTIGLSIVYRYPKYSNIPTSMFIELLKPEARQKVYWIIQHMMAVLIVVLNGLFAYLQIAIVQTSLGDVHGLNGWIMGGFIGLIFLVTIVYSVAATKYAHRVIAEHRATGK